MLPTYFFYWKLTPHEHGVRSAVIYISVDRMITPRDRMKHEHVLFSNARNLILNDFSSQGRPIAVKAKVFANCNRLLDVYLP